MLGTVEVVAPAVAVADSFRAASGWLLAALSVGSVIGGLTYGSVTWRGAVASRMVVLGAAMGAATCAVGLVGSVPGFAAGAVAIGLFLAPSIVTGYLAAELLVPDGAATEASVWTNTALNLGAAVANAGAGALIAGPGITAAMSVAGSLAVLAALCTPWRRLRTVDPLSA